MFNIILFGPPGSGKGTQSEWLIKNFGLTHISTGDLLRSEIEAGSEMGIEAKKYIDQGQLLPDKVMIGMIEELLRKNTNTKGYIFDGFPRTVAQAEGLDALFQRLNMELAVLISLDVEEEELKKRLIQRGKVSGRSDDNEVVITQRIKEYLNKTKVVESYYQDQGKLEKVNGIGAIEEISNNISEIVKKYHKE